MPNSAPFPSKNSDFNDYSNLVVPYLNANAVRLSVSAANLTALNLIYDNGVMPLPQNDLGWKQLWLLYFNDDTVTPTIKKLIKTRRAQLEKQLRLIYGDIPNSALTANDRTTLNLPLRDTNTTPIQPVNFSPVISFEEVRNGIQILRFQNPQTPDSNAMPAGQIAEVQTFVGNAGLPDNNIAFVPLRDTGKHLLQVNLLPAQKGQTAYYRARYKTPTGGVGPYSDVASEIVL